MKKEIIAQNDIIFLSVFDKTNICELYISWLNDKEIVKYSKQSLIKHSKISCTKYLETFNNTNNLFLCISSHKNEMIGTMTAYINENQSSADIGILIGNKKFRSLGYGFNAWMLLQNYLFNDLYINKITAGTMSENLAMIKIIEKSKMKFVYKKTDKYFDDEKFSVQFYFAKFRNQ